MDKIKKDRGLKTRTPLSNAVDSKTLDEVKIYSKDSGIPLSKILDKALSLYLESVKK